VGRQQHTIPQVLVVPKLPGRTPYLVSQSFLVRGRKPSGASWAITFPYSSKAAGEEPVNPVFDGSGRVSVEACRFVRAGSMEDIENHMKPMEVSPFTGSRYFILNGRDECFCIWNRYPSRWEHPYTSLLPVYLKARLSASIYGVTLIRGLRKWLEPEGASDNLSPRR